MPPSRSRVTSPLTDEIAPVAVDARQRIVLDVPAAHLAHVAGRAGNVVGQAGFGLRDRDRVALVVAVLAEIVIHRARRDLRIGQHETLPFDLGLAERAMQHDAKFVGSVGQRQVLEDVAAVGPRLLHADQRFVVEQLDVPARRQVALDGVAAEAHRLGQRPVGDAGAVAAAAGLAQRPHRGHDDAAELQRGGVERAEQLAVRIAASQQQAPLERNAVACAQIRFGVHAEQIAGQVGRIAAVHLAHVLAGLAADAEALVDEGQRTQAVRQGLPVVAGIGPVAGHDRRDAPVATRQRGLQRQHLASAHGQRQRRQVRLQPDRKPLFVQTAGDVEVVLLLQHQRGIEDLGLVPDGHVRVRQVEMEFACFAQDVAVGAALFQVHLDGQAQQPAQLAERQIDFLAGAVGRETVGQHLVVQHDLEQQRVVRGIGRAGRHRHGRGKAWRGRQDPQRQTERPGNPLGKPPHAVPAAAPGRGNHQLIFFDYQVAAAAFIRGTGAG
jgi:hypothetical protein